MKDLSKEKSNMSKAGVITLIVFVVVLGIMMTVFCVLYAINKNAYNTTSVNLENIYQRSFYDLVDNINNTETKLGKLTNSTDDTYSKKLLSEIEETATNAQNNISFLPISMNGIPETSKFLNKLGGFTKTLSMSDGEISESDKETLKLLHNTVSEIKYHLSEISADISKGYSIIDNSKQTKADYTSFTTKFQKTTDVEFPTMIYDGPFSDSVTNTPVKGLNYEEIDKETAQEIAKNIFQVQNETTSEEVGKKSNVQEIIYVGETDGKFNTFNFKIRLENGIEYYAQITKKGGKLLTLSSYADTKNINITKDEAINIAEAFAQKLEIKNMKCVWSAQARGDIYLNLAPVENGIILYPDLIKVKVDMATGNVLGWEATPYYTNHTSRSLPTATYSKAMAKSKISSDFKIISSAVALSPLDYNREVLTYEFKCTKNGETYYFYYNAESGQEENILKVVHTENGNLLM